MQKWKSNDSNIPTPWALTPGGDDEIGDVLERHAYYHPEISQILQILPSK
jgi:hypothetical protein